MAADITLQNLIEKVKTELSSPSSGPDYPIFLVDKVELELQINVALETNGEIGISILEIGKAGAQRSQIQEKGHTIKVTLSPILTREEQRELLEKDARMMDGIRRSTQSALRKASHRLSNE